MGSGEGMAAFVKCRFCKVPYTAQGINAHMAKKHKLPMVKKANAVRVPLSRDVRSALAKKKSRDAKTYTDVIWALLKEDKHGDN